MDQIQENPEVFEEIREDYEKLDHDERQQVKGIIVGMNLSRTLRGEAGRPQTAAAG